MQWHDKHRQHQHHLHMNDLHRMNGRHRKSGRLLVLMVHFVKAFVQIRYVVHAMRPIRSIVLIHEHKRCLNDEPKPPVFAGRIVNFLMDAIVERVASDQPWYHTGKEQRQTAQHYFVSFQFGSEELFRLTFPFVRSITLSHVKVPLMNMSILKLYIQS